MKKLLGILFAFALLLAVSATNRVSAMTPDHDQGVCFVISSHTLAPAVSMQEEGGGVPKLEPDNTEVSTSAIGNFLTENWIALVLGLMGFIELIVRLTPSDKDNSIFNWLAALINALLPNLKKGGGTFKVSSK